MDRRGKKKLASHRRLVAQPSVKQKPVSATRKLAARQREAAKGQIASTADDFAVLAFDELDEAQPSPALDAFEALAFMEPAAASPSGNRRGGKGRGDKPRKKRKKRVKDAWWATPVALAMTAVLAILLIFMGVGVRGYAEFLHKKNVVDRATFYPGVLVEGESLSGLTYEQALAAMEEREQRARDALDITMRLGDQGWQASAETLGYHSDYRQVLQSAWSVGRYGSLEERYQVVQTLGDENWRRDFAVDRGIDDRQALAKLGNLAESLSVPVVNAEIHSFDTQNQTFSFTQSQAGKVVDPNELLRSIKAAAAKGDKEVAIVRRDVQPTETYQTLEATYGLIASAVTDASTSSNNRLQNLRVASATLNGMRIEPGETFSFNKALGVRTEKKGYRPAAAYENGITTNQVGGGICQVSSTLFNAVAKADLKIVDRAPHSRPSSYVDLGKDAVVNWGSQDFKFKNTSDYPIYLTASLSKKKKLTISVYGKKLPNGMTIKIVSEKNATIPARADQVSVDPKLLPGERVVVESARNGYRATAYRVYLDADGKQIRKAELCKSYYAPSGAIVRVGA